MILIRLISILILCSKYSIKFIRLSIYLKINEGDIQVTIIESQGLNCLNNDFIKEQYQLTDEAG